MPLCLLDRPGPLGSKQETAGPSNGSRILPVWVSSENSRRSNGRINLANAIAPLTPFYILAMPASAEQGQRSVCDNTITCCT